MSIANSSPNRASTKNKFPSFVYTTSYSCNISYLSASSSNCWAAGYKRRREKMKWELRRTESGWEAITPADRTYVPNDVAVRHLAAQLALLTEAEGAAVHQETVLREESQLANLLSALLENK